MTEFLGALDDRGLNGNTMLLEIEPQGASKNEFMHILGYDIHTFTTKEKNINHLTNMRNIMISNPIDFEEINKIFLHDISDIEGNKKLKKLNC